MVSRNHGGRLDFAAVLGGSAVAQASPPAPSAPGANAWTEVEHPRPGGADTYLHDVVAPATNFLYGIGAYSPTDMWTVSYSRNPGQSSVTLAIRYDGSTWQIVNTPNPAGSSSNNLYPVADLAPGNAIAVGTFQDSARRSGRWR